MPRQNRPLVRDGRLQSKKRRTNRSYLTREQAAAADEETREETADGVAAPVADDAATAEAERVSPPAATAVRPARMPGSVRAMQQQGVRKRRDVNAHALMVRDSKYALHELRRIFILTVLVVVTLVVLAFVLR